MLQRSLDPADRSGHGVDGDRGTGDDDPAGAGESRLRARGARQHRRARDGGRPLFAGWLSDALRRRGGSRRAFVGAGVVDRRRRVDRAGVRAYAGRGSQFCSSSRRSEPTSRSARIRCCFPNRCRGGTGASYRACAARARWSAACSGFAIAGLDARTRR